MAQQKRFQDLNLADAYLFAAALEDAETCRLTLEILLGRKVSHVTVHTEYTVLFSKDYRSIRLDVYAQDDEGGDYNVEMQGENECNLPKRSRYHQAQMDVMSLPPGSDFNELKPNYVVFICRFDPFGKGLFHRRVTVVKDSQKWERKYMTFGELLDKEHKKGRQIGILLTQKMLEAGDADKISMLSDETFFEEMCHKYGIMSESN